MEAGEFERQKGNTVESGRYIPVEAVLVGHAGPEFDILICVT
jgi:hypothetical protein